jgi:hypothetical protein
MLTAGGPRQEKLGKRSEARGVRPPQKREELGLLKRA